jgi:hypothetical protein
MLTVLNFISTSVVIVVENLVLSPQGGYRASEVSLPKVATTLTNFDQRTTCWARRTRGVLTQGDFLIFYMHGPYAVYACCIHSKLPKQQQHFLWPNLKSALSYAILMSTLLKLNSTLKGASLIKNKKSLWSHLNHVTTLFPQSSRKRPASRPASLASRTNTTVHLHYQAYYIFKFRWSEPQANSYIRS